MKNNKTLSRRVVIGGASTLAASAAIIPTSVLAQSTVNPIDVFYVQGQYTYCDAKVLASYWGADLNDPLDAKIFAGQKILNGNLQWLKQELSSAGQAWQQTGQTCSFLELDNPNYSDKDLEDITRYWSLGSNLEAKLKIIQYVIGGGNPWVRSELEQAR